MNMDITKLFTYQRGPIPKVEILDDMITKLTKLRASFKTNSQVKAYNELIFKDAKSNILSNEELPPNIYKIVQALMRKIGNPIPDQIIQEEV